MSPMGPRIPPGEAPGRPPAPEVWLCTRPEEGVPASPHDVGSSEWCQSNGRSGSPGSATPVEPLPAETIETEPARVLAHLAGLITGTGYCAAVSASNASVTITGAVVTFEVGMLRVATTSGTRATGATTTVLSGAVNPVGLRRALEPSTIWRPQNGVRAEEVGVCQSDRPTCRRSSWILQARACALDDVDRCTERDPWCQPRDVSVTHAHAAMRRIARDPLRFAKVTVDTDDAAVGPVAQPRVC
jgi:hypothetical protein